MLQPFIPRDTCHFPASPSFSTAPPALQPAICREGQVARAPPAGHSQPSLHLPTDRASAGQERADHEGAVSPALCLSVPPLWSLRSISCQGEKLQCGQWGTHLCSLAGRGTGAVEDQKGLTAGGKQSCQAELKAEVWSTSISIMSTVPQFPICRRHDRRQMQKLLGILMQRLTGASRCPGSHPSPLPTCPC